MRNTNDITEEMVLPVINAMVHGSVKVTYADVRAKEKMEKAVFLINKIHKCDYMKHRVAVETIYDPEQKVDVAYELEDKYSLSWGDTKNTPQALTENDMTIEQEIHRVITKAELGYMDVNYGLLPYVRKVAKEMGVKTINDLGRVGIDARRKNESLYKKLEAAYKSGVSSISFDSEKINVQTLRVYAAQFNRFAKEKISVSWDGSLATVVFKADKKNDAIQSLNRAVIDAIETCGKNNVTLLLKSFIDDEQPTIAEWQRLGYDSQQEWSDHMKEKEEAADNDWVRSVETTQPGLNSYDADMAWNQEEDEKW